MEFNVNQIRRQDFLTFTDNKAMPMTDVKNKLLPEPKETFISQANKIESAKKRSHLKYISIEPIIINTMHTSMQYIRIVIFFFFLLDFLKRICFGYLFNPNSFYNPS